MAKILVIGATGHIGKPLVEALLRQGADVRVALRSTGKLPAAWAGRVEPVAFDLGDPATHARALAGVERLFLLTPVIADQVSPVKAVLAAAKGAGVRRVVRLSGLGASVDAPIVFGRQHGEAEEAIKASGIPYTLIRPNSFFQNFGDWHAGSVREGGAIYAPLAEAKVSYVDALDVAEVAAAALLEEGHEGQIYELSGPEAISHHDVAATLSRLLDRPVRYVAVSEADAEAAMRAQQIPDWLIIALSQLNWVCREGYAASVSDAVSRVLHRPARSFETYARENVAAFKAPVEGHA